MLLIYTQNTAAVEILLENESHQKRPRLETYILTSALLIHWYHMWPTVIFDQTRHNFQLSSLFSSSHWDSNWNTYSICYTSNCLLGWNQIVNSLNNDTKFILFSSTKFLNSSSLSPAAGCFQSSSELFLHLWMAWLFFWRLAATKCPTSQWYSIRSRISK